MALTSEQVKRTRDWFEKQFTHKNVHRRIIFECLNRVECQINAGADKETALGFMRQCQEYLQDNNPVMAWQMIKKAQQYVERL